MHQKKLNNILKNLNNMNYILDLSQFVPTEYTTALTIFRAVQRGFEFDAYDDSKTYADIYFESHYFLVKNFKADKFEICHDVKVDYINHTAFYKYADGYGMEISGDCSTLYFGEIRAIEREFLEWEYIDSSDKDYDKASRIVGSIIDSLGNMVQLIH